MFCGFSDTKGRSPRSLTKSWRCKTSLSSKPCAMASTRCFFSFTSANVRLYAVSTSRRTSSSIILAVSSEYGDFKLCSSLGNESNPIFSFMPYTATVLYAICVTFSKSFCAPVEIFPSMTCSAARPPSVMHIISISCCVVARRFSFGRYCAKPRAAEPRGTMDTLSKGSACSKNHPTTACPAS